MSDNPDWVFYSDDRQTEADIMPRLVASFPGFRPRWERHLQLWNGEPAGGFNDMAEFVHFVVLRRLLPKRPWRTLVCLLRQPCPFRRCASCLSWSPGNNLHWRPREITTLF